MMSNSDIDLESLLYLQNLPKKQNSYGYWIRSQISRTAKLGGLKISQERISRAEVVTMEGVYLRRTRTGFIHYCVACDTTHPIPEGWVYNQKPESPSFTPSFKQYLHTYFNGRTDSYVEASGICHYHITNGKLIYCSDCTHSYANRTVDLPELPEYFQHHFM